MQHIPDHRADCWRFTKPEFQAILAAAPKDASRANLQGLLLDGIHGLAATTNGHMLMAARSGGFGHRRVVIALEEARALCKRMKKREIVEFVVSESAIRVRVGDGSAATLDPAAVAFPPLHAVLDPRQGDPSPEGTMLNGAYLAAAARLAEVTTSLTGGVTLKIGARLDPIAAECRDQDGVNWILLIMPVRA